MTNKRSIFEEVSGDTGTRPATTGGLIDRPADSARRGIRIWLHILLFLVALMIVVAGLGYMAAQDVGRDRDVLAFIAAVRAGDFESRARWTAPEAQLDEAFLEEVVASSADRPPTLNAVPINQTGTYTLLVEGRIYPVGPLEYSFKVHKSVDDAIAVDLDGAGVLGLFESRLARFKHPRAVVFVDELPRNAMGKIQKHEIIKMLETH